MAPNFETAHRESQGSYDSATLFQLDHLPISKPELSFRDLDIPPLDLHHLPISKPELSFRDLDIPPMDEFETLVQDLRDRLGASSGITDADVDADVLMSRMADYTSSEPDWEKYAFRAPSKNYTRNLVDRGNGKSNLLILVWSPGKGSAVHDHANAHCIMKILRGRLRETRYKWPTVQLNNGEEQPLRVEKEYEYGENAVTYMSDKLGLHKISNPDPDSFAVSLHLYTPPNAAVYGCHTFNEETGRPSHMKTCTVYSEYGSRTKL